MQTDAFKGALFAFITAIFWGALPVALHQVIKVLDPLTIVWCRFLFASLWLAIALYKSNELPPIKNNLKTLLIILFAGIALTFNFICYNNSLVYLSPSVAQVILQLSPILLLLACVVIFKEPFLKNHKVGLVILIIGFGFFFNSRLDELFGSLTRYTLGILFATLAAVIWVVYAILQKFATKVYKSKQILFIIYCIGSILLLPFIKIGNIVEFNHLQWWLFLFCCLNTVIAYGAFAEAMTLWSAANVSAIVTLAPLFTILFMGLFHFIAPSHFDASDLNYWSYFGALLVVFSAIYIACGDKINGLRK